MTDVQKNTVEERVEFYTSLHEANLQRNLYWDPSGDVPLEFRMVELAGEAGELMNIIKKAERARWGLRGSLATMGQFEQEVADTVICASLIGMHIGIDVMGDGRIADPDVWKTFLPVGQTPNLLVLGLRMMRDIGRACAYVDQEQLGEKTMRLFSGKTHTDRIIINGHLRSVVAHAYAMCESTFVDLNRAVVDKFNDSSKKHNFNIMMKV